MADHNNASVGTYDALRKRGLSHEEALYEELWQTLGRANKIARLKAHHDRKNPPSMPSKRDEILAQMAQVCRANFMHFDKVPSAAERAALWLRRAVTHEAGKAVYIYRCDGNLQWRRMYEAGRIGGPSPFAQKRAAS